METSFHNMLIELLDINTKSIWGNYYNTVSPALLQFKLNHLVEMELFSVYFKYIGLKDVRLYYIDGAIFTEISFLDESKRIRCGINMIHRSLFDRSEYQSFERHLLLSTLIEQA